jgi:hypothetical protein
VRRVLVLLLAVGCGASSGATVVEVPPAPLPEPPPTAQAALPQPERAPRLPACTAPANLGGCDEIAKVRVGRISLSSSTCTVDLKVSTGEIGRVMRCPSGAVVVFDQITYGGSFDGRSLDACVVTRFPFEDGCTWQSLQRVRGTRDALTLDYSERPVSGTGCASSACTATADLDWLNP